MPWRGGLDEAGDGPNLGPLVLAATACHVPDGAPPCLWKALRKAVRKTHHVDNGRLTIDDSKKVNQGEAGLAKLEAGVLAALSLSRERPGTVLDFLSHVTLPPSLDDLRAEPWFEPIDPLPAANEPEALSPIAAALLDASMAAGLAWGPV